MKKALIYGLSVALLLVSLTACHKPQADQQTDQSEPPQAATSTPAPEPSETPEPPTQTQNAPEQLSDTIPAAPDENEDSQPEDIQPPEETTSPASPEPSETQRAEAPEQTTPAEPPAQTDKPQQTQTQTQTQTGGTGGTQTSNPATGTTTTNQQTTQQSDTTTTTTTTQSTSKDYWDQEVYDYLTPEQQAIYDTLEPGTRAAMNNNVRVKMKIEAEGGIVDGRDPTGEEYAEVWKHIQVGQ